MNYYDTTPVVAGFFTGLGVFMLFTAALSAIIVICMWKIFDKAGREGWKALIPIYNIIVLLEIIELPTWNIILFFIPLANIYFTFKIYIGLAHKFNKSTLFGIATIFFSFICLPILAFGDSQYNNM